MSPLIGKQIRVTFGQLQKSSIYILLKPFVVAIFMAIFLQFLLNLSPTTSLLFKKKTKDDRT